MDILLLLLMLNIQRARKGAWKKRIRTPTCLSEYFNIIHHVNHIWIITMFTENEEMNVAVNAIYAIA